MSESYPVPRDPRAAATQFQFHGEVAEIAPHGNGHINDTYRVECHGTHPPMRYILQHINRNVFRNPAAVMQNIERVTAHLEQNQNSRAEAKGLQGGIYFHPCDEDLSQGTPERKKPLGWRAFGTHQLWFRCTMRGSDEVASSYDRPW